MTSGMKEKLEQAQTKAQAAVTGQSADHTQEQANRIGVPEAAATGAANSGNNAGGGGSGAEVRSVGFGAQQFGGSQFARPIPAGDGGAGDDEASGADGARNSSSYGSSANEVKSVGFGVQQYGGSLHQEIQLTMWT